MLHLSQTLQQCDGFQICIVTKPANDSAFFLNQCFCPVEPSTSSPSWIAFTSLFFKGCRVHRWITNCWVSKAAKQTQTRTRLCFKITLQNSSPSFEPNKTAVIVVKQISLSCPDCITSKGQVFTSMFTKCCSAPLFLLDSKDVFWDTTRAFMIADTCILILTVTWWGSWSLLFTLNSRLVRLNFTQIGSHLQSTCRWLSLRWNYSF